MQYYIEWIFFFCTVQCEDLAEQSNGSITLNSDGISTFATITCDTGYTISGSSVAQCQPDGTWNIEQSICGI
jgi:hypothetical protein